MTSSSILPQQSLVPRWAGGLCRETGPGPSSTRTFPGDIDGVATSPTEGGGEAISSRHRNQKGWAFLRRRLGQMSPTERKTLLGQIDRLTATAAEQDES